MASSAMASGVRVGLSRGVAMNLARAPVDWVRHVSAGHRPLDGMEFRTELFGCLLL